MNTRTSSTFEIRGVLPALVLLLLALPAGAVRINDGVAALTVSNNSGEMYNYRSGGRDQLYQALYYYRTGGMTQEQVLVGPGTTSVTQVSRTGPTEITVLGSTPTFDYTLIYRLNGNGGLSPSIELTNTSGASLDLTLFSYQDWDVDNSPAGDSITWDGSTMLQSDGATGIAINPAQTPDAVQAAPYATLLNSLDDGGITNLDGTGLPFGPGDGTFAFQFDLTLLPNQSTSIIYSVPEPSSAALAMLGLVTLAWWGRDRRPR